MTDVLRHITTDTLVRIYQDRPAMLAPWVGPIRLCLERYGITSHLRASHWLGQIGVESGGLRWTEELWGPTTQQKRYDPPGTLAARLGNTREGDGYRFRGRGLIQLTGRHNYELYARTRLGDNATAEEAAELLESGRKWQADVAGWYWRLHELNRWADADNCRMVTLKINGGYTHLDERQRLTDRARVVLRDALTQEQVRKVQPAALATTDETLDMTPDRLPAGGSA